LSAPASPALGTDAYHGRSLLKGRPTPQGDNRVPVLAISKVCQIFRAAHCSSSGREYRFGRSTASPDAGKIDGLCAERDRLKAELPRPKEGLGRKEVVKHFQDDPNQPPFIKALAEVRHLATREGWCYQHVQAIIVAIDQYAEAATGNRNFFLNKPQRIG
jgi:hypothetical protein